MNSREKTSCHKLDRFVETVKSKIKYLYWFESKQIFCTSFHLQVNPQIDVQIPAVISIRYTLDILSAYSLRYDFELSGGKKTFQAS